MTRQPAVRRSVRALAVWALLAAPLTVVLSTGAALAATTYNVVNGNDSGAGSLRAAIAQADADDVDAVIQIDPGLSIGITGVELDFSPATATQTLTINGSGATLTRTSGTGRILNDAATGILTINDTTIANAGINATDASGGALKTAGALTVNGSAFSGITNTATPSGIAAGAVLGGVLNAQGDISVSNTSFSATTNEAQAGTTFAGNITGGVAFSQSGSITLTDVTIDSTSNTARASTIIGASITGGIAGAGGPSVSLASTSVSGTTNVADTSPQLAGNITAGLFFSQGAIAINDSSIVDTSNTAHADAGAAGFGGTVAGGVLFTNGTLTVSGSTVSGIQNAAEGGGIFGADLVGGAFFTRNDETLTGSVVHDVTNTTTAGIGTGSFVNGGVLFAQGGLGPGGAVTLTDSTIRDVASDGHSGASLSQPDGGVFGGAIVAQSNLTLTRSTVANSTATATGPAADVFGAGVYALGGTAQLTNSTVTGNVATADRDSRGGGIFNAVPITLAYTDVVGNAAANGANIASRATVVVPETTPGAAAEVHATDAAATVEVFGSVISDPGGGGTNCLDLGVITSDGSNRADDTSCGLTATSDVESATFDPQLGALADNGGPTPTLLPQTGSPLIDAIPDSACDTAPLATSITTDQRSLPRPEVAGGACDIGAVEVQAVPPVPPVPPAPPAPIPTALVITPKFTG